MYLSRKLSDIVLGYSMVLYRCVVMVITCWSLPSSLVYSLDNTTFPWAWLPGQHIGSGTTLFDTERGGWGEGGGGGGKGVRERNVK